MRIKVRTFRKDKYKNHPQLREALSRVMDNKVKPHYIGKFNEFVEGWSSVTHFEAMKRISSDQVILYVYPKGPRKEVWYYVDRGTRPHKITAKNAPFLVFPNGMYMPKTEPIAKNVGLGNYMFIDGLTKKRSVKHLGSEARDFTKTIVEDEKSKWVFDNAVAKAIRDVFT